VLAETITHRLPEHFNKAAGDAVAGKAHVLDLPEGVLGAALKKDTDQRLRNNFNLGCPHSRAKALSPVKAVDNAASLEEELP
jgi:hypothetical protein